jgi:hypothetical protein
MVTIPICDSEEHLLVGSGHKVRNVQEEIKQYLALHSGPSVIAGDIERTLCTDVGLANVDNPKHATWPATCKGLKGDGRGDNICSSMRVEKEETTVLPCTTIYQNQELLSDHAITTVTLRYDENDSKEVVRTDETSELKIDVVIPSSIGPKVSGGRDGSYDTVRRDRDNGELQYMLRSLIQHAPWVHRIFVLVNGSPEPPAWMKDFDTRVTFVDRCKFMPPGSCPTRNSHAVLTNLHLMSVLSEQFILAEDDIFLGVPLTPSFFFSKVGKPFVFHRARPHSLYTKLPPALRGKAIPKSNGGTPHFWYPMLKSAVREIAEQYPEYTTFVSSHISGRFNSKSRATDDKANSQEEDPLGVWQSHLLTTEKGVFKNILYAGQGIGDWEADPNNPAKLAKVFGMNPLPVFLNINDVYSISPKKYNEQRIRVHSYLKTTFEKPRRI